MNDISVIFVTAHRCAGCLKKSIDLQLGSNAKDILMYLVKYCIVGNFRWVFIFTISRTVYGVTKIKTAIIYSNRNSVKFDIDLPGFPTYQVRLLLASVLVEHVLSIFYHGSILTLNDIVILMMYDTI